MPTFSLQVTSPLSKGLKNALADSSCRRRNPEERFAAGYSMAGVRLNTRDIHEGWAYRNIKSDCSGEELNHGSPPYAVGASTFTSACFRAGPVTGWQGRHGMLSVNIGRGGWVSVVASNQNVPSPADRRGLKLWMVSRRRAKCCVHISPFTGNCGPHKKPCCTTDKTPKPQKKPTPAMCHHISAWPLTHVGQRS